MSAWLRPIQFRNNPVVPELDRTIGPGSEETWSHGGSLTSTCRSPSSFRPPQAQPWTPACSPELRRREPEQAIGFVAGSRASTDGYGHETADPPRSPRTKMRASYGPAPAQPRQIPPFCLVRSGVAGVPPALEELISKLFPQKGSASSREPACRLTWARAPSGLPSEPREHRSKSVDRGFACARYISESRRSRPGAHQFDTHPSNPLPEHTPTSHSVTVLLKRAPTRPPTHTGTSLGEDVAVEERTMNLFLKGLGCPANRLGSV